MYQYIFEALNRFFHKLKIYQYSFPGNIARSPARFHVSDVAGIYFHADSFLAFRQKEGKNFLQLITIPFCEKVLAFVDLRPFRHRHYDSVRDSLNLAALPPVNHLKHIRHSEIVAGLARYIFAFRLAELISDSLACFRDFGNLSENEIPDELVRSPRGCADCDFSVRRADSSLLDSPVMPRNLFPSRVEYHKVMYQVQESFTMAQ